MSTIPPDCVFTFEHLQQWLDDAEAFATPIPEGDARRSLARFILEYTGAIRIEAARNNDVGQWRDDHVSWLMDRCAMFRHEAEDLSVTIQRNRASRDGAEKRKAQAAAAFDREGFLIEGAALKVKNPTWTNSAIATHLAKKYKRSADYLSKLLPKKK